MLTDEPIFRGCIPALMTPCGADGSPNFDALVAKGCEVIATGMRAVVYCGSMGDWPLLTDEKRQEGVRQLVAAGVPVIVGTGAQNPKLAAAHAAHAQQVGAAGLMVIPRVLSRGTSAASQRAHFAGILTAGADLPAVIYNSPYYGFETKADLFFDLRREHANLVGFKEFGGAGSLGRSVKKFKSPRRSISRDWLTLIVGHEQLICRRDPNRRSGVGQVCGRPAFNSGFQAEFAGELLQGFKEDALALRKALVGISYPVKSDRAHQTRRIVHFAAQ